MTTDVIQEMIKRSLQNFNWAVIKPNGLSFSVGCEYINGSLSFAIQIRTLLYTGELEIYLKTLFEECDEFKGWNYCISAEYSSDIKVEGKSVLLTHLKKAQNLDEIKDEMFKTEKTFRNEPIHTIFEMIGIETNSYEN